MEGDKKTGQRWFFTKLTEAELWKRYVKSCDEAEASTQGNSDMLFNLWKQHTEITNRKPSGHDDCDICSDLKDKRAALDGLSGASIDAKRAQIDKDKREHDAFNSREREKYTDAVHEASHYPVNEAAPP